MIDRPSFADQFAIALLALGAALAVLWAGGSPVWLALGAMSFGAALALKLPLSGVVHQLLQGRAAMAHGIAQGALSATLELGVAWAALDYTRAMPTSFYDFVGFAVGAGSAEALGVSAWAAVTAGGDGRPAAPANGVLRHAFAIERALAWTGQLCSRLLLCAARFVGWWWPLAIAFLTFAATDGLAAYGHARGWDWSRPRVLGGYYLAAGAIVLAEIGALAYLWLALR